MKTPILLVQQSSKVERVAARCVFVDETNNPHSIYKVPRFIPAHSETGILFPSKKKHTSHYPDSMSFPNNRLTVKNGVVQDQHGDYYDRARVTFVRVIPDEYVNKIDAMDTEIKNLKAKLEQFLLEAARHGRPLRVKEIIDNKAAVKP